MTVHDRHSSISLGQFGFDEHPPDLSGASGWLAISLLVNTVDALATNQLRVTVNMDVLRDCLSRSDSRDRVRRDDDFASSFATG